MARLPRALRRFLLTVLLLATALWTGAVGCLWANESRLVFRANRSRVIASIAPADLRTLRTPDGVDIDAVLLPARDAAGYWILFCPPAGGTIHGRLRPQLEALRAAGYNVLAFDYRGFGRNRGRPSEPGVYTDAATAYRHLTGHMAVPPAQVILAGRSLGSAVAVELATRVPSAGLMLLSAIDSVPASAARLYPWAPVWLLASNRFDTWAKAVQVRVPVVQVHGGSDWLMPMVDARALFARFPGEKRLIASNRGHNVAGFTYQDHRGALRIDEAVAEALDRFWPRAAPAPMPAVVAAGSG